jgi:anti-sigma B factor antagonist
MDVSIEQIGATTVVRFNGDLDTNTSAMAQDRLNALIEEGNKDLLVSLRQVGFVSSAGLRILLATAKRLNLDGSLKITDLNETVHDVFEISGFNSILDVYKTEEDALQGA